MLWRVRTTLPDRPGTLASLAQRCGDAGVNILGLQVFPGIDEVTDELVLRAPDDWTEPEVIELLEASGGAGVVVRRCSEAALVDQPTRYVQAARLILERPLSFPEVLAQLLDADSEDLSATAIRDTMELTVGDVAVQIRRAAPFTATEHARGSALAELVDDVLQRSRETAAIGARPPSRRLGGDAPPDFVVGPDTVTALLDGVAVGLARVGRAADGVLPVTVRVEPAWQRRGIGTRLLLDVARLAHARGAAQILLTTRSDNHVVLPMVMAAGLRGRIRMAGDELTVRIPVRDLRPLPR